MGAAAFFMGVDRVRSGARSRVRPRSHVRTRRWGRAGIGVYDGPGWWTFCAVAALGLAAFSALTPHRVWGVTSAAGYLAAAWLCARGRGVRTVVAVAAAGSAVLPLLVLVVLGRAQLEVEVVARSAGLLLSEGTPYSALPTGVEDFNPYLPGMAVFGLPQALLGASPATDPRLWMGAAFIGALALALPAGRGRWPYVGWLAACPLVALPLAVGGVDLPVAGLMCLGLAQAGRGRAGRAGLVLGLAAALKWTAWPALPVAVVLLAVMRRAPGAHREPLLRGTGAARRRPGTRQGPAACRAPGAGPFAALRCGAVAVVTAVALVLPAALRDPGAFHAHVVAFPLGLTDAVSSAASPLPGHLLATYVPGGRTLAVLLLAASALLVCVSLLVRPPRTASAAALRLALGLLLAIAFMPATRFGYLVHPLVLAVWAATRTMPGRATLLRTARLRTTATRPRTTVIRSRTTAAPLHRPVRKVLR
ncbi:MULTISPECIES: hypothetical protein [unclassified Streptomyces]|uniref:hypothetical protein n=1 Tax=Streptomyces sp. NPDC127532 TaxID=3345399 RepID=UPI00364167D8